MGSVELTQPSVIGLFEGLDHKLADGDSLKECSKADTSHSYSPLGGF
jgi:hypothetical protein